MDTPFSAMHLHHFWIAFQLCSLQTRLGCSRLLNCTRVENLSILLRPTSHQHSAAWWIHLSSGSSLGHLSSLSACMVSGQWAKTAFQCEMNPISIFGVPKDSMLAVSMYRTCQQKQCGDNFGLIPLVVPPLFEWALSPAVISDTPESQPSNRCIHRQV